jgi:hypothetical protein
MFAATEQHVDATTMYGSWKLLVKALGTAARFGTPPEPQERTDGN